MINLNKLSRTTWSQAQRQTDRTNVIQYDLQHYPPIPKNTETYIRSSDGANATCDNNNEQEPTATDRASRNFNRTTLQYIRATVFQNSFSHTLTQHKIYRRPFLTHSHLDLISVERHRYSHSMHPTEHVAMYRLHRRSLTLPGYFTEPSDGVVHICI